MLASIQNNFESPFHSPTILIFSQIFFLRGHFVYAPINYLHEWLIIILCWPLQLEYFWLHFRSFSRNSCRRLHNNCYNLHIEEETIHWLVETTSLTFSVSSFYGIYYFAIEFVRKEKQGESRLQVEIKESCKCMQRSDFVNTDCRPVVKAA